MKTVDIKDFEKYYTVSDNGDVFSKRKERLIRPSLVHPTGYYKVFLVGDDVRKWRGVHQLVLTHFTSERPSGMESHHKDHNKGNNHVSNLKWVTRSENILRSFQDTDRECYWKGKKRGEYSEEHRRKMALAKYKPVKASNGIGVLQFGSVGEFIDSFGTYRRKFNRCVGTDKEINGYKIEFI